MLPNLVLINAGTNDVAQDYEIDNIEQTMEDLVNKLLDNIPGTVVIVSTLLVNRNATKQALTEQVNPKYVSLVGKLAAQGKLVYLADMSSITAEMINARDGTHPTDCKLISITIYLVEKTKNFRWLRGNGWFMVQGHSRSLCQLLADSSGCCGGLE